MTKDEIRYLLKRYCYIYEALKNEKLSAFFSISGRKERIEITDTIKKFSNAVLKALEKETNDFTRGILNSSVIEGNSDIFVFTHFTITRGSFYAVKENFFNRLFCLCVHAGIVSEDEI